jgi:hypothetical protein
MVNSTKVSPNDRPVASFYDPVRDDVRLAKRGPLRYACPECSKVFDRPSSLEIHLIIHTGEQRTYLVLAGPHVSYLTS